MSLTGSLLAGAVGDALGAATEFDSMAQIRELTGPEGITDLLPAYDGIGKITDDTQMTLFTVEGLIRAHAGRRRTGEIDLIQALQQAYQRWLHTQGVPWTQARGPGETSLEPDGWLIGHRELFSRRAPGLTCFEELAAYGRIGYSGKIGNGFNISKGCGGVMRAAPVAVWPGDGHEVFELGATSAALTHGHPSGYLPAGALALLVRQLLLGDDLAAALGVVTAELSRWKGHEETLAALTQASALKGPLTPERIESLGSGKTGESALAISVFVALHAGSLDEALLAAVNHGGDSDSTGSICGNIVGAIHGVDALRPSWLDRLELRETIEELAADVLAEFGPVPPADAAWSRKYP